MKFFSMIMSFFVIAHAQAQLMGGFKSIAVDDAQVIKAAEVSFYMGKRISISNIIMFPIL